MNECNDEYVRDPYSLAVQPRYVGFTFTNAVHPTRVQLVSRLIKKAMVLINKNKRLEAPNYYFKMEKDVRTKFYRF